MFDGGLYLPDEKAATARRPIEPLPPVGALHVPLQFDANRTTRRVVAVGTTVGPGDLLAQAVHPDATAILSPLAGRVAGFCTVRTARHADIPAVTIEPVDDLGGRTTDPNPATTPPTSGETSPTLPLPRGSEEGAAERMGVCGVVDVASGLPLHCLLARAATAGADTLIVNGLETEPYLTANLRTLVEQPDAVLEAAEALGAALGIRSVRLAIPFRHRRLARRMTFLARGRSVLVETLADKYPQCHPRLLARVLTHREPPPGGAPLDVGVVVLPLATAMAAGDALRRGRPHVSRVVTVAGEAVERPGNFIVPFGTPVRRLLAQAGVGMDRGAEGAGYALLIAGGPMTGVCLPHDEVVTSADFSALLVLRRRPQDEPIPCIRCGWCLEDCPAGIDPSRLAQLEWAEQCSAGDRAALAACIECGLCTYVCPSQLPLAETLAQSRRRWGTRP